MRAILPVPGIPDDFIRVINDRFRELESLVQQSSNTQSAALPNVGTPGRFVTGTTDEKGRVIERGRLQTSDLPGGGYPNVTPNPDTQSVVTGSRALGTTYQNTTGKPMFVSVTYSATVSTTASGISALTDSSTPPTTVVARKTLALTSPATGVEVGNVGFWVLPGNYYKITTSGAPTLTQWTEWN